jgi:hypothetical protein
MESHSGMTDMGKLKKLACWHWHAMQYVSQDFNYITFLEYTFAVL